LDQSLEYYQKAQSIFHTFIIVKSKCTLNKKQNVHKYIIFVKLKKRLKHETNTTSTINVLPDCFLQ
jgi:hypothetical protein